LCKQNQDGTVGIAFLGNLNLERATLDNSGTIYNLTKENGNLFDSYIPEYYEYTKENDETIYRIYNGFYINESKNDLIKLNVSNEYKNMGFGQMDLDGNYRNTTASSFGDSNFYTWLTNRKFCDNNLKLDHNGKTITVTDTTNDSVETYTLIEFN